MNDQKLKSVRELHLKALDFADAALLARAQGDLLEAHSNFEKAYHLEVEAAIKSTEPLTQRVLYGSASSLAREAGDFEIAKDLSRKSSPKIWMPDLFVNAKGLQIIWNVFAVTYRFVRRGLLCKHAWKSYGLQTRCDKCGAWNHPDGWYFD